MRAQLIAHLDEPKQLEALYRTDKSAFKRAFNELYPTLNQNLLIQYWAERLNFVGDGRPTGSRKDLLFILAASLLAGLIAKLPAILTLSEEFFYSRNAGFIIFPLLTGYFAWKNKLSLSRLSVPIGVTLAGLVFINLLPDDSESDTLVLACIHLPILLWLMLGLSFAGEMWRNSERRLGFLTYNGDLIVMTGLMLIAGAILSGITFGLFSLIGMDIREFYFNHIGIPGLAAAPLAGTYIIQRNPQLVGRISPLIAQLFSPLVLIMLVSYLVATVYSGKDLYNDRDFLLIFNALLIGVMAIIFFSIAEISKTSKSRAALWILFLLSVVTIAVNGIALSAILFRISTWGITPNRAAVLGSNLLMLLNLLLVMAQLFRVISRKANINVVGKAIAYYLPLYGLWAIIVVFLFPLLFGFG